MTDTTKSINVFADILELFDRTQLVISKLHDIILRMDFNNKEAVESFNSAMDNTSKSFMLLTQAVQRYSSFSNSKDSNC